MAKGKKGGGVPVRGYATTSVASKKAVVEVEESSPEADQTPELPPSGPPNNSGNEPPKLVDQLFPESAAYSAGGQAFGQPAWPGEEGKENDEYSNTLRTVTFRLERALDKWTRLRQEIFADPSVPTIVLDPKMEIDSWAWIKSSQAPDSSSIESSTLSDLLESHLFLEKLGFPLQEIHSILLEAPVKTMLGVVEWICQERNGERLPCNYIGQTAAGTGSDESLQFVKDIIRHTNRLCVSKQSNGNSESSSRPTQPSLSASIDISTEKVIISSKSPEHNSISKSQKDWILRQQEAEELENWNAGDDLLSNTPSTRSQDSDLHVKHAQAQLALLYLVRKDPGQPLDPSRALKKKRALWPARAFELLQILKKLEQTPTFSPADAQSRFDLLVAEKEALAAARKAAEIAQEDVNAETSTAELDQIDKMFNEEEKIVESPFSEPTLEPEPLLKAGIDEDVQSNGSSDNEDLFGDIFAERESASNTVSNSISEAVHVWSFDLGSWTGRMPKVLLQELVSKKLHASLLKFSKIKDHERGFRAAVSIKGRSPKEVSMRFEMNSNERAASHFDAQQFVSVKALYHMAAGLQLRGLLPPVLQPIWDIEARSALKESAERVESLKNERKSFILQLLSSSSSRRPNGGSGCTFPTDKSSSDLAQNASSYQKFDFDFRARLHKHENVNDKLQEARKALPAFRFLDKIISCISNSRVTIISGATGCGKSTQVPQYILEHFLSREDGDTIRVVCTQPRRISAISLATRVSAEMGDTKMGTFGSLVGYQVRMDSKMSKTTRLVYCTTGVLLRQLVSGDLSLYSHIVLDEIHDRTVESDFLMLLLKHIMRRNLKIKIVLMSATADSEKFAKYFEGTPDSHGNVLSELDFPILSIPGRTFPVTTLYLEDAVQHSGYVLDQYSEYAISDRSSSKSSGRGKAIIVSGRRGNKSKVYVNVNEITGTEEKEMSQQELKLVTSLMKSDTEYSQVTVDTMRIMDPYKINLELVEHLVRHLIKMGNPTNGSILVFLPGVWEINRLYNALSIDSTLTVIPLHSGIDSTQQSIVFERFPNKVVLATNIAETGITIPDVYYVIDTVKARELKYDKQRNMSCLADVFISKANCAQRRGRAGRVAPGVCFHLISRVGHEGLSEHRPPEIMRLPLEELCLRVAVYIDEPKEGSIRNMLFEALDPPSASQVDNAVILLKQIGALESDEKLTALGKRLADLPLDARLGKLLLFSIATQCLDTFVTICASLNVGKSPFIRPQGFEKVAQDAKVTFKRLDSDLMTIVQAYMEWRNFISNHPTRGEINSFCGLRYLSHANLILIEECRSELLKALTDCKLIRHLPFSKLPRPLLTPSQLDFSARAVSQPIITFVLTCCLYPNVLMSSQPLKLADRTAGKTLTLHFPGKSETVSVHSTSVLNRELQPLSLYASHGVRSSQDVVTKKRISVAWDLTRVSGLGLIMGWCRLSDVQCMTETVTVDGGKLVLKCSAKTACLLARIGKIIKGELDRLSCSPQSLDMLEKLITYEIDAWNKK